MSENLSQGPEEYSLVDDPIRGKLPSDLMEFIKYEEAKMREARFQIDRIRATMFNELTRICDSLGISIVELTQPICACDDVGHATRLQTFDLATWGQDIVPWLAQRDTTMYLWRLHRSVNKRNDPDVMGLSVCSRYYESRCPALVRLARESCE